jgi:antitoxin component YwqK of YwqJK toxin-antitoxin module
MNFLESISSNLEKLLHFQNFVVLFPDLPRTRLVVETHDDVKRLMFMNEMLQMNQFSKTGRKIEEVRFRKNKRNGKYDAWYPNGQHSVEGSYVNSLREGHWTYWYNNGVIEREGKFINGKESGLWITKYENGENAMERTYIDRKIQEIRAHFRFS